MSTAALTNLRDYLTGTLSPADMRWISVQLKDFADKQEQPEPFRRYTKEELNAMLDEAEAEIAAGKGIPSEEVWREEEFADMDKEQYTPEEAYEMTMKDIKAIYAV
ncbi:MAG: hypothetical protein IJQ44_05180 [Bacteroidaceae bacterium]|nr:hypothetical protein [Bacteroidaceae bacterium]